jgi:hypothetical protein
MLPSPVVVEVPTAVAARPSALHTPTAPKLMPAIVMGVASSMGLAGVEHGARRTFLAITLERIARQRRAQEHEIVERRQLPLGAQPPIS